MNSHLKLITITITLTIHHINMNCSAPAPAPVASAPVASAPVADLESVPAPVPVTDLESVPAQPVKSLMNILFAKMTGCLGSVVQCASGIVVDKCDVVKLFDTYIPLHMRPFHTEICGEDFDVTCKRIADFVANKTALTAFRCHRADIENMFIGIVDCVIYKIAHDDSSFYEWVAKTREFIPKLEPEAQYLVNMYVFYMTMEYEHDNGFQF